jgi:hypothetical protein
MLELLQVFPDEVTREIDLVDMIVADIASYDANKTIK